MRDRVPPLRALLVLAAAFLAGRCAVNSRPAATTPPPPEALPRIPDAFPGVWGAPPLVPEGVALPEPELVEVGRSPGRVIAWDLDRTTYEVASSPSSPLSVAARDLQAPARALWYRDLTARVVPRIRALAADLRGGALVLDRGPEDDPRPAGLLFARDRELRPETPQVEGRRIELLALLPEVAWFRVDREVVAIDRAEGRTRHRLPLALPDAPELRLAADGLRVRASAREAWRLP